MFDLPLFFEHPRTFAVFSKAVIYGWPPTTKGPDVDRTASFNIHISHGTFNFGNDSLLLE